jgi:hypothetical protein
MIEELSLDIATGYVFGITVYFAAWGVQVFFRSFKLAADVA